MLPDHSAHHPRLPARSAVIRDYCHSAVLGLLSRPRFPILDIPRPFQPTPAVIPICSHWLRSLLTPHARFTCAPPFDPNPIIHHPIGDQETLFKCAAMNVKESGRANASTKKRAAVAVEREQEWESAVRVQGKCYFFVYRNSLFVGFRRRSRVRIPPPEIFCSWIRGWRRSQPRISRLPKVRDEEIPKEKRESGSRPLAVVAPDRGVEDGRIFRSQGLEDEKSKGRYRLRK
jgi:hypothetical protein